MQRFNLSLSIALTLMLGSSLAFGHTRLKPGSTLNARSDNSGIKSGPCGSDSRTPMAERTVLTPGQTLMIYWEETIYHPGNFRIAYSEDGSDTFDSNILVDDIPSDGGPGPTLSDPTTYNQFSQEITVPTVECDDCVIQLIQVMTDRNPPTLYFSCADVRIRTNPDDPLPGNDDGGDPATDGGDADTTDGGDADTGTDTGADTGADTATDADSGADADVSAPAAPTGLKLRWVTGEGAK